MKSRPILFSGPMVRALLNGTKTQTRRIVKAKNMIILGNDGIWYDADCVNPGVPLKCKYGKPGDVLIVKETSRLMLGSEENLIQYRADMVICDLPEDWTSDDPVLNRWIRRQGNKPNMWRPSILMPVRAARIALEIVSVRIERLNEITPADAEAEGVGRGRNDIGACYCYGQLWESINGPGSWSANPYVWVVEFRKLETPTKREPA